MPGWASPDQRKAFYAAAGGHSTLGIPQETAQKIVAEGGTGQTSGHPHLKRKGALHHARQHLLRHHDKERRGY